MKYAVILLAMLCMGCQDKPDEPALSNRALQDRLIDVEDYVKRNFRIVENNQVSHKEGIEKLWGVISESKIKTEVIEVSYDPNALELSFLEPTDPNWARDYGDNERTRHLFTTSIVRAKLIRDEKIISEIAKRLIALEQWQRVQPTWHFEDMNIPYWYCEKDGKNLMKVDFRKDPNEVKK